MKKVILAGVLIISCSVAMSQDSNTMYRGTDTAMDVKSYATIINGIMMIAKDGTSNQLVSDKILKDGTILKTTGAIVMKNGQTQMLKEGQLAYFTEIKLLGAPSDLGNKRDSIQ